MERREKGFVLYGFLLGLVAVLTFMVWHAFSTPTASAESKGLPRAVVIATHSVGTTFYSIGGAIAKVVTEHSPMTATVRPHPGPPAWYPGMNTGEIEFGIVVSADGATAYRGVATYRKAFPNIRLLMRGAPLVLGFYAPASSKLRNVADLRGKRVPSNWSGIPIIRFTAGAALASAGLTWDDVVKVPVADLRESVRAFLEGRTDVMWHSVRSPAVQEANARTRGGIRALAVDNTPEGLKRMKESLPGAYKLVLKAGAVSPILENTPMLAEDIYVMASKFLAENVAYEVLKILWDHNEDLRKSSARLKAWTRKRMPAPEPFVPYHPGAIRFFRDKGVWSAEMEALHKKLLQR